jgi:hypothetical protein
MLSRIIVAALMVAACTRLDSPWVSCGSCGCVSSGKAHAPAYDSEGRKYCTVCDEYIA